MPKGLFVRLCWKKELLIRLLVYLLISSLTPVFQTTVIILKKNRTNRDVYFIDASKEFDKGKIRTSWRMLILRKILNAYKSREDMDKFAHLASFEEIVENDYNLNIPRYVDTFEEEEVEPLTEIVAKINETNATIEVRQHPFLICLVSFMERPKKQMKNSRPL